MYNPYNWDIEKEFNFSYDSIAINPYESYEEHFERFSKEKARWTALKRTAKIGIELAQMNLNDSIAIELESNDFLETVEHDMMILKRKIEEYNFICDILKRIDENFSNIIP